MPGIFSHLYLSGKFLTSGQKFISRINEPYFQLGAIFPDIGYFPANNPLISNLAHYVGSSLLPELVFQLATSDDWKAFALGWLLHLHTDIIGHPFVNKLAAEISDSPATELSYEEDIFLHAKLENSLDRLLIKEYANLISVRIAFPQLSQSNPLTEAVRKIYQIDLKTDKFKIHKIPFQIKSFYWLQRRILQKNILLKFLTFFLKFQTETRKKSISSILEDINLSPTQFIEYQNTIDLALEQWLLPGKPNWLPDQYNLDTGRIAVMGEYKLADETFSKVNETICKKNKYWQKIKADFEKSIRNSF